MSEIEFGDQQPIDSYGPGGFRIGGEWLAGSQIVTPLGRERLARDTLDAPALEPLIDAAGEVDVVLIGQGEEMVPLPPAIHRMIEEAGLGVETMTTPAACRTYNVLLAEARRVAAVLIAL